MLFVGKLVSGDDKVLVCVVSVVEGTIMELVCVAVDVVLLVELRLVVLVVVVDVVYSVVVLVLIQIDVAVVFTLVVAHINPVSSLFFKLYV